MAVSKFRDIYGIFYPLKRVQRSQRLQTRHRHAITPRHECLSPYFFVHAVVRVETFDFSALRSRLATVHPDKMPNKVFRLPPLPRFRIRKPNKATPDPCISVMSTVLGCWASQGYGVQGCEKFEQA